MPVDPCTRCIFKRTCDCIKLAAERLDVKIPNCPREADLSKLEYHYEKIAPELVDFLESSAEWDYYFWEWKYPSSINGMETNSEAILNCLLDFASEDTSINALRALAKLKGRKTRKKKVFDRFKAKDGCRETLSDFIT